MSTWCTHTFQAGRKISAVFVLCLLTSEEVFYTVRLDEIESYIALFGLRLPPLQAPLYQDEI